MQLRVDRNVGGAEPQPDVPASERQPRGNPDPDSGAVFGSS
jgi:hypothetical protein